MTIIQAKIDVKPATFHAILVMEGLNLIAEPARLAVIRMTQTNAWPVTVVARLVVEKAPTTA